MRLTSAREVREDEMMLNMDKQQCAMMMMARFKEEEKSEQALSVPLGSAVVAMAGIWFVSGAMPYIR